MYFCELWGAKNDARYELEDCWSNDGFWRTKKNDYNGNASEDNSTDEIVENGSYAENTRKELAELDDLDI